MQIVIEIPEEYYNAIKSIPDIQCDADMLIIKSGTPLPKGHGDLKDMGNLQYVFDLTRNDHIYSGKDIEQAVRSMKTIIPTDKEAGDNRKTGWYIAHGMIEDRFWCSCGFVKIMDRSMTEWKFCPKCGARMEESE